MQIENAGGRDPLRPTLLDPDGLRSLAQTGEADAPAPGIPRDEKVVRAYRRASPERYAIETLDLDLVRIVARDACCVVDRAIRVGESPGRTGRLARPEADT